MALWPGPPQPSLSVAVPQARVGGDLSVAVPQARGGGDINVLCEGMGKTTLLSTDADFADSYKLGEEIGHGGWSVVYKVERKHGSLLSSPQPLRAAASAPAASSSDDANPPPLAVKVMDKAALGRQTNVALIVSRLRAECRVLAELSHPHVVQMQEIFESPQRLLIVMERAEGGALLERIVERGWFTEPDALHVMRQLVGVLSFMHTHGVIHRDIKPENILLAHPASGTWDIKVTDFGLVKIFSDQVRTLASRSIPSWPFDPSMLPSLLFLTYPELTASIHIRAFAGPPRVLDAADGRRRGGRHGRAQVVAECLHRSEHARVRRPRRGRGAGARGHVAARPVRQQGRQPLLPRARAGLLFPAVPFDLRRRRGHLVGGRGHVRAAGGHLPV